MIESQVRKALEMMSDGQDDEAIEEVTGISLLDLIGLRASAAAAPARVHGQQQVESP